MTIDVTRMHRSVLADECQEQPRALGSTVGPARREPTRVHQALDFLRHEPVVDESIFLDAERRVAAFQVARPVTADAMPQRQVLRARRRADRIGLNETEAVQRPLERGGAEQAMGDGEAAKILERDSEFSYFTACAVPLLNRYTLPPFITNAGRVTAVMSVSGSPSSPTMSAS
jgi:hypothetical protein